MTPKAGEPVFLRIVALADDESAIVDVVAIGQVEPGCGAMSRFRSVIVPFCQRKARHVPR